MNNWQKRDLKYIWHPYTQMKDCKLMPPILIEKAQGLKLYDTEGNFYYDTISSWWCNVHGHNHPKIKDAIKKQLDSLEHVLFAGFTHKPAIALAEKIISLAPTKLTKVFFSDNGSTAVEVALKMSFQYWKNTGKPKKTKFISLDYGYHGDTFGTMSVSGIDLFNEAFSLLFFPSYKVPSPYCYRCPVAKERDTCDIDCIQALEKLLEKKSNEVAGIILEPLILASGGMIIYPKEYLARVANLAREFNVHLIVDEVATGFGRTGKMFASDYVDFDPDFMCLSKGITSGYLPLALTLTTDKIYKAFYADYKLKKTFYHGHTYTANPISCSAALASLEVFEEEKTLKRTKKLIPLFKSLLKGFINLPAVGDIRSIGLIGAMELVRRKDTKEAFSIKNRIGLEVYKRGLKKNLVLRPLGNIIYLFLPLCIKEDELQDILERTYSVIKSL
ncbi:MAG: adenosylmethionine--8-amino-7-oxononanoate transaminase [Candidatus Omnitrophica bacterium]|nr:adenosylmethionine--8-amino-7-oxononanoate transaminase [Candidatus Omnitrophota bacterium]MDD5238124.1 adenosylmethionine--8-amino-7-oxononanoate transaminase [Candidatus Omnitrophota bacterium]